METHRWLELSTEPNQPIDPLHLAVCVPQTLETVMSESKKLVRRSHPMRIVGYYLARCGERANEEADGPPRALNVNTWKEAYDIFYDALGDGRSLLQFRNSMKNARDTFDTLFENGRIGWIGDGTNNASLSTGFQAVHEHWNLRSEEELETYVFGLLGRTTTLDSKSNFGHESRTEGGEKVFVSTRPERDSKLRNMTLDIHGYNCMACNFNFESFYGEIGKNFIEVHHIIPLTEVGERETNPEIDLIVLCANCHRMVHRQKRITLSLKELKNHIRDRQS